MKQWKITVITVCYNSAKTIEDTILSVLHQTYSNYEYIIVDGMSTDATLDIIKKYDSAFCGKLKWISEPDKGIYDAMNKGIEIATGDLICLLNSDDWYETDAFEIMNNHYNGEEYKVQYGMQRIITNEIEEQCNIFNHHFLNRKMIPHQTCFVTKKVYDDFGIFNLKYKSAADYDFMIRVSLNSKVIFEPIYKVIVCFRSGGMCSTVEGGLEQAELKKIYGFISSRQYIYLKVKARILDLARKLHLLE